ncbi:hypothetical protein CY34DRAFT_26292 [Suillus luteus UH-Slu-Lm8-n1]|uniref:Uncharacterized protein n=1 Tax=Suillus luteus UH-Slu-Lm8-n1 TaxID=930992 RepID=A0A0D0AEP9_9AGAM|nr:hypothetical protein CY34DRAFT_26292 [Suillus luteus UH-Slu-Lm8-n1]
MKALIIYDNIKSWIHQCFCLLLDSGSIDYIGHELHTLRKALHNVSLKTNIIITRKKAIRSQIDILTTQFSTYKPSDDGPVKVNTDTHLRALVNVQDEIAQIVLFLVVICRVILGVSRSGCDLIMKIISIILFLTFQRSNDSLNSFQTNILKQIPMTSKRAKARFHLTGKTIPYAVCSCHCTYAPTYVSGSTTPAYPKQCMHHPTPGTECGKALLTGVERELQPKRTFLCHDFKDYLSSLLSCRDIETMMDQACDNLMDSINSPHLSFVKNSFEA